jgi:ligand-binding sensor domain-containing protein
MEDKTGKLWFGTRGEPCFYDGKTFTVFKNKDGKAFNNVWSIIEDKKSNIWLGDNDGLEWSGHFPVMMQNPFIDSSRDLKPGRDARYSAS